MPALTAGNEGMPLILKPHLVGAVCNVHRFGGGYTGVDH
jgi:hypothetical protein